MSFTNEYTVFRVHYRTQFGDFISIRGNGQGLSWDHGIEAAWISEHEEDVWVLTLPITGDSVDEVIHFKPLVNDEVWAKGYDYVARIGEVVDIYPFFFSSQGSIFKTSFQSPTLNNKREMAIYLPPSYDENSFKRYPVILFQDGHNLFFSDESFCGDTWQLAETMDHLSCEGGIKEYIVVGVYPIDREWEYLPTKSGKIGGGADLYLDSLLGEIRPVIDKHLRTTDSYAIAGSSYGGVIALYAWVTRPHEFDICGAFSPAVMYDNNVMFEIVRRSLHKRPDNHKLYMDCGSVRDMAPVILDMARSLERDSPLKKEQLLFLYAEGHEHTERHWAMRAPRALAYMFADLQRAPPVSISYASTYI